MTTTEDPLYWGLILIIGLLATPLPGLFGRQYKPKGVWDIALSVFGAVAGAHIIGPALQIAANPPAAEFHWPGPVSMQLAYLIVGAAAGAILVSISARHLSKER